MLNILGKIFSPSRVNEEIQLVIASGLFNKKWYLENYPDVADSKMEAVEHYLTHGATEGRDPGPGFNTRFYITDNPNVDFSEINPLIHYIKFGKANQRDAMDSILAKDYNDRMWGGYSRYAIPLLRDLMNDSHKPSRERERAAWYLARWYFFNDDFETALELTRACRNIRAPFYRSHYISEAQCLIKLNRLHEADEVLDRYLEEHDEHIDIYLLKSLTVPFLDGNKSLVETDTSRLEWINKAIASGGLAPLAKKDDARPLSFDNITSFAKPEIENQQEKVSIIVPVYNACNTISTALESLINQTWENIEIIVVDDCSTDDTCKLIEDIVALDKRIKLVKKDSNEGAYIARNVGLAQASGNFVMVHDSDDWSHPQKIELQISEIRKNDQYVAIMSHWIRFDETLAVVGPWIQRGDLADLNFSSLMIKRHVFDKLGNWPEVKVSGDTEFRFRIARYYGFDSICKISPNIILSLALTRENSLTRTKATHMKTLYYGIRWLYRDIYNYWHSLEEFRSNPKQHMRNAPAPSSLLSGRDETKPYHLVLICDFSKYTDMSEMALKMVMELQQSGLNTAIFHWKEYGENVHASIEGTVYKTCQEYKIDILSPSDSVNSKYIVIADDTVLQFIPDEIPSIKAKYLFIGNNKSRNDNNIPDTESAMNQAANTNARELFGLDGKWMSLLDLNTTLLTKSQS